MTTKNHAVNKHIIVIKCERTLSSFAMLIPIIQKTQKYLFIIDIVWGFFYFDVLTTDTA